jgi:hypothetical protein
VSEETYPIARLQSESGVWFSLYYYNGNFFYPLFLSRNLERVVFMRIKQFKKDNAALVRSDRAHPDYKDKVQLSAL